VTVEPVSIEAAEVAAAKQFGCLSFTHSRFGPATGRKFQEPEHTLMH
jgi:hypothetical protein